MKMEIVEALYHVWIETVDAGDGAGTEQCVVQRMKQGPATHDGLAWDP